MAIRSEVEGAVGRMTLARPEKLNALNRATLEGLAQEAAWFDAQPGVKVVVITGEGRAFSAGFDLDDTSWRDLGPPEESARVGRAMAEAIEGMRALTIASIRGYCIGGGVVLAAACDLRIAAAGATFRIPEVDLGIPLFWNGVALLRREIGPARTKELVLTGRPFDAHEAFTMGFVNSVVGDSELEMATDALARMLAEKPALVLETTKRQVDGRWTDNVDEDVRALAAAFADEECRMVARNYRRRRGANS